MKEYLKNKEIRKERASENKVKVSSPGPGILLCTFHPHAMSKTSEADLGPQAKCSPKLSALLCFFFLSLFLLCLFRSLVPKWGK